MHDGYCRGCIPGPSFMRCAQFEGLPLAQQLSNAWDEAATTPQWPRAFSVLVLAGGNHGQ